MAFVWLKQAMNNRVPPYNHRLEKAAAQTKPRVPSKFGVWRTATEGDLLG